MDVLLLGGCACEEDRVTETVLSFKVVSSIGGSHLQTLSRARRVIDDLDANAVHSVGKTQCRSSFSRICCSKRCSSKSSCVAMKTCSRCRRNSLHNLCSWSDSLQTHTLKLICAACARPVPPPKPWSSFAIAEKGILTCSRWQPFACPLRVVGSSWSVLASLRTHVDNQARRSQPRQQVEAHLSLRACAFLSAAPRVQRPPLMPGSPTRLALAAGQPFSPSSLLQPTTPVGWDKSRL